MICLPNGTALEGGSTAATTVTYTIEGMELDTSTPPNGTPFNTQGQLAIQASAASIYTPSGSKSSMIASMHFYNTSSSVTQTVNLYVGGVAGSNQIITQSIPPQGWLNYDSGRGWQCYNSSGVAITTTVQLPNSQYLNATTTLIANSYTTFYGSTASQTLTLPAAPPDGTVIFLCNISTVAVSVAAGAGGTVNVLGTTGTYSLVENQVLQLAYDAAQTTWYCMDVSVTPGTVLGKAYYAPTSASTYTLVVATTGLTALDTTNLKVIFNAPNSGNVYIKIKAFVKGGAAAGSSAMLGVVSSTGSPGTLVGTCNGLALLTPTATAADNGVMCELDFYVTGLTAGTSYTYYLAGSYSGTACSVIAQSGTANTTVPTGGPALIEVIAA